MEDINIKNDDIPKLIIDLLIKNSCAVTVLTEMFILQTGATTPADRRDQVVQDLYNGMVARTKELREIVKEEIFKQYGHIDLEGL